MSSIDKMHFKIYRLVTYMYNMYELVANLNQEKGLLFFVWLF